MSTESATPLGARDSAMVELLYATGVRVSELLDLRMEDLRLDAGYITCTGKGSKERVVPLGGAASARLGEYIRGPRVLFSRGRVSPYVFLGARGRRLTRQAFVYAAGLRRTGRSVPFRVVEGGAPCGSR